MVMAPGPAFAMIAFECNDISAYYMQRLKCFNSRVFFTCAMCVCVEKLLANLDDTQSEKNFAEEEENAVILYIIVITISVNTTIVIIIIFTSSLSSCHVISA
ncbi:hypothetical protein HELRODRAFT_171622 [Helobdella robusta]|uniref:Uncharacterized protein n=1 Tax=Helobdella robusta TaxID=6412 RepID=T1F4G9_HELRO|nr:hypothetical protein HELRODRAFT_171622 [Helobdella robusta]ESO05261.1 hypothetical protein HELRODRAFT_171622 [Helobdella robusta]